jgi:ABC-type amino acid transport substrate-binding protein
MWSSMSLLPPPVPPKGVGFVKLLVLAFSEGGEIGVPTLLGAQLLRKIRCKRYIILGAALLLLVGVVALLLTRGPRGEDALARVQRTGVLRVGLDASFPPFEMLNAEGQVVGYDADLATAIAEELGVEAQFVNVGFDGLYDALQAERVDVVISGLPYDERRTRDVHYSEPYFDAGQVLVVRNGAPGTVDGVEAAKTWLAGRNVAVEWGSMGDMLLRQWQTEGVSLEIAAEADAQGALAAVASGRADAAVVDRVSAYANGAGAGSLAVLVDITSEPYVMATALGSPRLARSVGEALAALKERGALAELEARWLR